MFSSASYTNLAAVEFADAQAGLTPGALDSESMSCCANVIPVTL